ncbi:hypothetical protein [[Acholeplasma] multilocale]|uniref:hypothetical protein n=1 Tax=[Acholeplasma] multilocale TaxID=264638 RepID=UPI00047A4C59|nr:hypothetical protein [[Acholeplasma] multilocale]
MGVLIQQNFHRLLKKWYFVIAYFIISITLIAADVGTTYDHGELNKYYIFILVILNIFVIKTFSNNQYKDYQTGYMSYLFTTDVGKFKIGTHYLISSLIPASLNITILLILQLTINNNLIDNTIGSGKYFLDYYLSQIIILILYGLILLMFFVKDPATKTWSFVSTFIIFFVSGTIKMGAIFIHNEVFDDVISSIPVINFIPLLSGASFYGVGILMNTIVMVALLVIIYITINNLNSVNKLKRNRKEKGF